MAELLTINGASIVAGLEWRDIKSSTTLERAIAKLARPLKARLYAQGLYDSSRAGLLPGTVRTKAKQVNSLALSVLDHPAAEQEVANKAAVIAIWDLSLERTALVIISDGTVHRDLVVSPHEAAQQVRDFTAFIQDNPFVVIGDSEQTNQDFKRRITLEEWVDAADFKNSQLKAVPRPNLRLLVILTMLGLASGGGLVFKFRQDARAARIKAEREQLEDPNYIYQRDLAGKLAIAGAPAARSARALLNVMDGIPLQIGGWFFTGVKCEVISNLCEVKYARRKSGGTNSDFDRMKPAVFAEIHYPGAGDELVAILPIANAMPSPVRTPGDPLPDLRMVRIETGSVLQTLSKVRVSETDGIDAEWTGEPAIYGAPSGADLSRIRNPIMFVPWRVTAPRIYGRDALLGLPDHCAIADVALTVQPHQTKDLTNPVPDFKPEGLDVALNANGVCYATR
jgi:hypothetical protein